MARLQFFRRFILLPSLVGFAYCACQPISTNTDITLENKTAAKRASSAAENTAQLAEAAPEVSIEADPIQASSDAYQVGLELATSANTLSQTAISPDDWSLVLSRWSRAVDQLEQVTSDSEQYPSAQQKIAEYTDNATQIQTKIEQLQTEVYVPLDSIPRASLERAVSSDRPTDRAAGKQRVRVPIVRRLHGTPVVQVTFNGSRTYDMILDTGASRTLITQKMASELEIETTEKMVAATASAAEVTFDIGQARTITMDSLTLNDVRVSIGGAIGIGLLGNDFFAGYDVIIRSRENVVELVKS